MIKINVFVNEKVKVMQKIHVFMFKFDWKSFKNEDKILIFKLTFPQWPRQSCSPRSGRQDSRRPCHTPPVPWTWECKQGQLPRVIMFIGAVCIMFRQGRCWCGSDKFCWNPDRFSVLRANYCIIVIKFTSVQKWYFKFIFLFI